jgi:hypothetical protein
MKAADRLARERATAFTRLTDALLDLRVEIKGYRNALPAANESGGGGLCSSTTSTTSDFPCLTRPCGP